MGRGIIEVPCLRNPDLPCPSRCQLRGISESMFRSLAEKNNIPFDEAVGRARGMDPVRKIEVMLLIKAALSLFELVGQSKSCKNEEMGRIIDTKFGAG